MNNKLKKTDVVVVGAGFAGIYLTDLLSKKGLRVQTIDAADDVGGTWYWNRYPGAKCDIQSMEYSYSFSKEIQDEWVWADKYAAQPEILKYIQFVADKLDVRKNIKFNTNVTDAIYDEKSHSWTVSTDKGDEFECQYFIMATGCLSVPSTPNFKGMADFKGELYHTGSWPEKKMDFKGKKVAVIGTGSSGIQVIPVIAETADKLTVFVRDSSYTLPANNKPLSATFIEKVKADYETIRNLERYSVSGHVLAVNDEAFEEILFCEPAEAPLHTIPKDELFKILDEKYIGSGLELPLTFQDLTYDEQSDEVFREYLDGRIRSLVNDPEKAAVLIPKGGRFYDRRPVMDTHYYETFNKENVDLVDVNKNLIIEFTESGIRTADADLEFDVIVCATGFDAMTGAITRVNIQGKEGKTLKEYWKNGPRMYLGLMANGFPNLFTVTGPGSPSVLSNMLVSIEQHVEWIDACIQHMKEQKINSIEAEYDAEEAWIQNNIELAQPLFLTHGNSWYVGANVPGKPRVIMPYTGGVSLYREKCEDVVNNGYEGFIFG